MKRNLLTQMRNEWRDNFWIMIGLSIVSLAIWLFCSALFTTMRYSFLPLGFDEKDVYVVSIGKVASSSPSYKNYGEETSQVNNDDLRALLAMIRGSQNVEYAGFSKNGTPYVMGGWNASLNIVGNEPDTIGFAANFRFVSPDVVKVLRLRSLTGKDTDYLHNKLKEGEIFVAPDPEYDASLIGKKDDRGWIFGYRPAEALNGKYVMKTQDSINTYHVADVVELVRRSGYDSPNHGGVIMPVDESGNIGDMSDILIRVKPGCGDKFRKEFESTPEMMSRRNVYLRNLMKLSDKKLAAERNEVLDVRLYVTLIVFLLIILFLGLLGTFWFRMQQRVSEIAIRRVCGASRSDIFRRIISEGMILLIGATILTGIIGWLILKKTELIQGFSDMELIWFELATIVIVAVGIVLSILYPAWRAMQIEPAEAVRDE